MPSSKVASPKRKNHNEDDVETDYVVVPKGGKSDSNSQVKGIQAELKEIVNASTKKRPLDSSVSEFSPSKKRLSIDYHADGKHKRAQLQKELDDADEELQGLQKQLEIDGDIMTASNKQQVVGDIAIARKRVDELQERISERDKAETEKEELEAEVLAFNKQVEYDADLMGKNNKNNIEKKIEAAEERIHELDKVVRIDQLNEEEAAKLKSDVVAIEKQLENDADLMTSTNVRTLEAERARKVEEMRKFETA